jgi:CRISPR-associated endonuclease Cas1
MQIIIDTTNTTITVKNKCFFFQNKTTSRQISPKRISSIAVTSNCTFNAAVVKLAANHQVPILFFNNFGTIQARMYSPYFVNLATLRKKQLLFSRSEFATDWIIRILKKKTIRQILNLRHLSKQQPKHQQAVGKAVEKINKIINQTDLIENKRIRDIRNTLMGYEGSISRQYFQTLNLFLSTDFKFIKRSRRPALDYFNAGLNYLYGMTYSVVESGVFAKGLDPSIGFLHVDAFKKPTLVFDLIEPIRPLIDGMLMDLILENQLETTDFVKKSQGYWVSKKGKRTMISSFNDFLQTKIKVNGSTKRLKDHIYQESNTLGNLIDALNDLS